jgi:general secretion pathway protein F
VFAEAGVEMPLAIRCIIGIGRCAADRGWTGLLIGCVTVLAFRRHIRNPVVLIKFHAIMLRTPVFGAMPIQADTGRFLTALRIVVKAGVLLARGTLLAVHTIKGVASKLGVMTEKLREGEPLGAILHQARACSHLNAYQREDLIQFRVAAIAIPAA